MKSAKEGVLGQQSHSAFEEPTICSTALLSGPRLRNSMGHADAAANFLIGSFHK
jgi:hypothetical protein